MAYTNQLEEILPREGYIIYYDYSIGGFTLDEWLIHWAWQYFINSITVDEYLEKIDYISADMPGVYESRRWDEHTRYLEVLRRQ